MNKLFRLPLIVALLLPLAALGQSPDPVPPPTPPFLATIPDQSACTISIKDQDQPAQPPKGQRLLNQLVMTKSGATRQLVFTYTDGSRAEVWFSKNFRIERIPPHEDILITPIPRGGEAGNTDFPHLDWLALANYFDIESQNGKSCWYFKTKIKLSERNVFVDYSAYIDVKTKLPVAWDFGPVHYELVSTFPATLPDMPPDYAAALKAYQAAAALPNSYRK
jgi:hypothetical protein